MIPATENLFSDAFAAERARGTLRPHRYSLDDLLPTEVDIAISHCGVCHSDLHLIDKDWGVSTYPLVPGHEIIGTVIRAGEEAAGLRPGQRVGVGWLAGSCMGCEQCRAGNENLCAEPRPTCVGRQGGYASRVRVDARFAAPIPDSLPSESAAPLLCAGLPCSHRSAGADPGKIPALGSSVWAVWATWRCSLPAPWARSRSSHRRGVKKKSRATSAPITSST